ncbi:hypothetical protein VTK26DRAFT_8674 [Humicola hyalothermophila]
MDPSRYSTRLVALKLAYLGKRYGGFEYQAARGGPTLPSIEEELWKALVRSCLIWPEDPDKVDFSPWEYSKCGRTDRGVSAFGQVIGIRLRSNKPLEKRKDEEEEEKEDEKKKGEEEKGGEDAEMAEAGAERAGESGGGGNAQKTAEKPAWDPIADEINYPRILNRLLPPDIRVLAWAPTLPPNFSARFSCWERQYRYFFTQPAFAPTPAPLEPAGARPHEGWLDIDAMRAAAKLFEGVHDFRNFCKIDGGKQITSFKRRIFEADIVEVPDAGSALPYLNQQQFKPPGLDLHQGATVPKVYYFHVRGSAFLWHQIRHMVGILFAVGQGLEKPSVVTDLLDIEKQPGRPNYTMADDVPLVLWDCIFPKVDEATRKQAAAEVHDPEAERDANLQDGMDWVWVGEDDPAFLHGSTGLVDELWGTWHERKLDELLANQLLEKVARQADLGRRLAPGPATKPNLSQRLYKGGNAPTPVGMYVPVVKRPMLATPEEVNNKWAQSKGFANSEELTKTKNWRSAIRAAKENSSSTDG